jgi:hypothetical protein
MIDRLPTDSLGQWCAEIRRAADQDAVRISGQARRCFKPSVTGSGCSYGGIILIQCGRQPAGAE